MLILKINLKAKKKMKVEQALELIRGGKSIKGIVLEDLDAVQVSVRDALSFARAGVVLPEENVFYDDEDIEYDEEFDETVWSEENLKLSWEEKAKLFSASKQEDTEGNLRSITLDVSTNDLEIDAWLSENRERLSEIIKPIIKSLFKAEKMIKR